jgi:protein TilB
MLAHATFHTFCMQADVQPRYVRLLIKGRLLQLRLPCEVLPDESAAQRSKASGRLVLNMPKADPVSAELDLGCVRARPGVPFTASATVPSG